MWMWAGILDGVGQYIQDALSGFLSWLSDVIATALLSVISHLPAVPSIDWTPFNNVIGTVNAWVPVPIMLTCAGLYVAWWLGWSAFRLIAKLIWSG